MLIAIAAVIFGMAASSAEPDAAKSSDQISATPPPSKEAFHIYLMIGQSNMVGRDTRNPAPHADNPRILALNPDGQWIVAKDPLHTDARTPPGVGPGLTFASEMVKDDPKVIIGLVPCAVGGTSLKRWLKGADLYEQAVSRGKLAVQVGVIKGVLWHQGESNAEKGNPERYEAQLTKMLGDLRADLGLPNLPIVVGQLGEFLAFKPERFVNADAIRAAIKHVSETVPNVGFVDSSGLDHKGDMLHFSTDSAKELGRRYAKAMQTMQQK